MAQELIELAIDVLDSGSEAVFQLYDWFDKPSHSNHLSPTQEIILTGNINNNKEIF